MPSSGSSRRTGPGERFSRRASSVPARFSSSAVLRISPGVWAGRYAQSGDQTVETVGFDDPELELGALHPIVVSEIVRDVELLMRRT